MPGVNMASKWRIDGVFSDMRIEKKGTSFQESWTSGNLYSVAGAWGITLSKVWRARKTIY